MSREKTRAITAFCPACGTRIRFAERPKIYDIVNCPECEESFEVVGLTPLQLEWVADYDDEDEWLDDDDEWSDDDDDEYYEIDDDDDLDYDDDD